MQRLAQLDPREVFEFQDAPFPNDADSPTDYDASFDEWLDNVEPFDSWVEHINAYYEGQPA